MGAVEVCTAASGTASTLLHYFNVTFALILLLCLQAHMSRQKLPISDYVTDTKSVLDNSLRILQVRAVWGRGDEGTRHNA